MVRKWIVALKMVLIPASSVDDVEIGVAGTCKAKIEWGDGESEEFPITVKFKRVSHHYSASSDNREITITGSDVTGLSCYDNKLTSLDIRENPALNNLNCRGNKLTQLNVSKNTSLRELNCSGNRLTHLNAGRNSKLWNLDCSKNQLTTLYLGRNMHLWFVNCAQNQLTSLNVNGLSALSHLKCRENRLTVLDTYNNKKLQVFDCSDNKLKKLDLQRNTRLEELDCSCNQLSIGALNNMLDTLHENPVERELLPGYAGGARTANIADNPGTKLCDLTVAVGRGWVFGRDRHA